jgi:Tfp pilus assembly pilus retraction ATPase PilT
MTSQKSDRQKLVEIEDLIFEHNKNNKVNALKGIIRNFENAQIGERSNITKDMTAADVAEIDLVNYVATTIAIKSSDYLRYRYNTLSKETKAPFYMQEFVSKMIYASIVNPELFSAVFDVKKDKYKDDVSLVTVVLGSAGSGKTTAILGSVIDMIRQSNTKSNI